MGYLEIIGSVLTFFMSVWKYRTDPEQAKIRAAVNATKDMNDDIETFEQALAKDDKVAIAAHFEQLRDRVLKATGGNST